MRERDREMISHFCVSLKHVLHVVSVWDVTASLNLYLSLLFPFYYSVVSVELEVPTPVTEGANLTVCTTLTFIGGTTTLECDITVNLDTADGTKACV